MKKQKRWETEEQIISRIEFLKRAQKRCLEQARKASDQADLFRAKIAYGGVTEVELNAFESEIKVSRLKSERKFLAADKRNATLKHMGEKLAAFRTQLLPMAGNTDKAVV